jgi:hypothetical protein
MQSVSSGDPTNNLTISVARRADRLQQFNIPLTNGGSVPATLRYSFSEQIPIQLK